MKTLLVTGLLAVASVAPIAALAASGNGETWGQNLVVSGPSLAHAQVVAELRDARANHTIAYGEFSAADRLAQRSSSNLTRRQVKDEIATKWAAGKRAIYLN